MKITINKPPLFSGIPLLNQGGELMNTSRNSPPILGGVAKPTVGALSRRGGKWRRLSIALVMTAVVAASFSCSRTDQKPVGPPEKVIFAYTVLPDATLAHVAQRNGYYLQEGLDVTAQVHQIGKAALQSVLEGKADFATVAETPVMFAIMKGEKIAIIATINSSNRNMAVLARKDKDILVPHDLKGKKIATTFGTIGEFFMDTLAVTNGLSRKQMNVINLPAETLQDALISGKVDAISTWNPILIQAQRKLGDGGIAFYGEDIYTQTYNVVATQEYIRKNPLQVKKILFALIKAEEFVGRNPAEAQKIVANASGTDMEALRRVWPGNTFRVTLDQPLVLALEEEARWAIKGGLVRKANIPNYLNFVYLDGLASVKPAAVRILR
jgi:NitT/TauT family transport system substrate-binding protein